MIRNFLIVMALVVFGANFSSAAPIIVLNGSGGSEYALVLASDNLATLLSNCVNDCGLSAAQEKTLNELLVRSKSLPAFEFSVNQDQSWIYQFRGADQVEFNQSALWQDLDKSISYDLPYAASIWLRVLSERGDRLPDIDSIAAALVAKLRSQLLMASWTHIGAAFDRYEVNTIRGPNGSDRVIAHDDSDSKATAIKTFDLTSATLDAATTLCDSGSASDLQILSLRVNGAQLQAGLSVTVELLARWQCGADAMSARVQHKIATVRDVSTGEVLLNFSSLQSFVTGQ